MNDMDAVVLWHEMNHILAGKTYIDTAFAALNPSHFDRLEEIVLSEINHRKTHIRLPELTVASHHFT